MWQHSAHLGPLRAMLMTNLKTTCRFAALQLSERLQRGSLLGKGVMIPERLVSSSGAMIRGRCGRSWSQQIGLLGILGEWTSTYASSIMHTVASQRVFQAPHRLWHRYIWIALLSVVEVSTVRPSWAGTSRLSAPSLKLVRYLRKPISEKTWSLAGFQRLWLCNFAEMTTNFRNYKESPMITISESA